jgi:hypothetical protein
MKKSHIHYTNLEAFLLNLTVSLVAVGTYQMLETIFKRKSV